jgi:hypothetical protein
VTLAVNVDPAANLNPDALPTIFGQLGIPEYARNDPELIDCVPAKPGPEIVPDVLTVPEIALEFVKQYPIVVWPDESTGLTTNWMLVFGVTGAARVVPRILPIPCVYPILFVVIDTETVEDEGSELTVSNPEELMFAEPPGAFPVVIFAAQL